ncbi:ATP-binding cassette domain-containing protein [Aldersonia kunmingensis]|uniref:ATP-binding cassette domain-containing protein n=1 Tax=Aldersonia kunmingensis TaxID=408066 RepID=UPI00083066D0|nr:ATP-binding cassette domain-containing protein [Aldersonia kunmingensis]
MTAALVEMRDVVKHYRSNGGRVCALNGVDLDIEAGTILGVLGPNGAGKTTTVRILTTLLRPDSGSVRVAGHDALAAPGLVRKRIGVSGQYAAVDENLTGFENLRMVGRLYGLRKKEASERARELLEDFALSDAADRRCGGYSGGMRRRLDLAGALIGRPELVVLDEPTTGLDPIGRADMWSVVRRLVADGTTVLLTTQYLEEADQLADRIVVVARGEVIARGTAAELKASVGADKLCVTVQQAEAVSRAARILESLSLGTPDIDDRDITVPVADSTRSLAEAVSELVRAGVDVEDAALHRTTLDDVFMSITGAIPEPLDTTVDERTAMLQ